MRLAKHESLLKLHYVFSIDGLMVSFVQDQHITRRLEAGSDVLEFYNSCDKFLAELDYFIVNILVV